jgi:hypothetical protein
MAAVLHYSPKTCGVSGGRVLKDKRPARHFALEWDCFETLFEGWWGGSRLTPALHIYS